MRQVIEVALDDQGRILVPAEAAGPLGLAPGVTLVAEETEEGGVRLQIQPEEPQLVMKGGVLVAKVEPLGDLDDFVQRERERRVASLLEQAGR